MAEHQVSPSAQGVSNCRGCGFRISGASGTCPRCGYPMDPSEEFRLLAAVTADLKKCAGAGGANIRVNTLTQFSAPAIHALQRVAVYGGAARTVGWLIWHYQERLSELREAGIAAVSPADISREVTVKSEAKDVMSTGVSPVALPPPSHARLPLVRSSVQPVPGGAAPARSGVSPMPAGLQTTLPAPRRPRPNYAATLRPLVDSPAGLMVALGTFLILIAILALPFLRQFSSLAIGVTVGAQIFFAAMAAATRRTARFREFSRLYAVFFAITIPLLVIDIVLVYQGSVNIPIVVAVAALYAAVTYGAFAIYQRFSPFGYLSAVSLVASVAAFALAFQDGYQWAACAALLPALPGLASMRRGDGRPLSPLARLFDTTWAVLRNPARVTMLAVVGLSAIIYVPAAAIVLLTGNSSYGSAATSMPSQLSIGATLVLLLVWLCLYVQRTQWNQGHYPVTLLSLLCVLVGIHDLQLPSVYAGIGYALALVSVAALFDFISRTRPRFIHLYMRPGLFLDVLALVLIAMTPLLVAPFVPVLAFTSNPVTFILSVPPFPFGGSAINTLVVFALGLSSLLSVGIVIRRSKTPFAVTGAAARVNQWPWALLLSGVLLTWTYGAVVLWAGVDTFWSFFVLTLVMVAAAVFARQKAGRCWSYPIDVVALGTAVLALLASLQWDHVEIALYALAIIFYVVLLAQRRSIWMFIPFIFALIALPYLFQSGARVMLAASVLLPLVAAVFHRSPGKQSSIPLPLKINNERPGVAWEWEWPLAVYALICGAASIEREFLSGTLSLYPWILLRLPAATVIAIIALAWYACAALSRYRGWLWPAGAFAASALFFIDQQLWTLAAVTLIAAPLGLVISQIAGRAWALPLYWTALLSGVILGITGEIGSERMVTTWILLGVAALVYLIASLEKIGWGNWLAIAFAAWSFSIAATMPHTLFLFAAASGCAVAAILCSFIIGGERGIARLHSKAFLMYALPLYAAAGAAMLLTGYVGTLVPSVWGELLVFAVVAYIAALKEGLYQWQWVASVFGIWGIVLAALVRADAIVVVGVGALLASVLADRLLRLPAAATNAAVRGRLTIKASWGWAWYIVALAAFIVAGIYPSPLVSRLIPHFAEYNVIAFAVVLYIAGLIEEQPLIMWTAPLFALWSLGIAAQGQDTVFLFAVTMLSALLAVGVRRLRGAVGGQASTLLAFTLPLYGIALAAALLTGGEGVLVPPATSYVPLALLVDAVVAFIIARLEGLPAAIVLPAGLAAWAIALSGWATWQLTLAYSLLCVIIFVTQYAWNTLQPAERRRLAELLSRGLAIGGQALVVIFAAGASVLPDQGATAQGGVFALLVLAGLVIWFGYAQQAAHIRFWCNYGAGLLLALAITGELNTLSSSPLPLDLLTISPASYLVVTAPFLLREKTKPGMQQAGYVVSAIGALALLLPSFFLSFGVQGVVGGIPGDLLAVFLLLGETLALLLLGIAVRERFFVLGGCALVVVGALRVFFYAITNTSPLAILAMVIAGLAILGVAVFLVLRQRGEAGGAVRHTP